MPLVGAFDTWTSMVIRLSITSLVPLVISGQRPKC
jgi:hypothetical protein